MEEDKALVNDSEPLHDYARVSAYPPLAQAYSHPSLESDGTAL